MNMILSVASPHDHADVLDASFSNKRKKRKEVEAKQGLQTLEI